MNACLTITDSGIGHVRDIVDYTLNALGDTIATVVLEGGDVIDLHIADMVPCQRIEPDPIPTETTPIHDLLAAEAVA